MSSENTDFTLDDQCHSAPSAKRERRQMSAKVAAFALQKIWLPHALYSLIPFFYLFAGAVAVLSTLYVPSWSWFLPYALLTAGVAFHAAIAIGVARYRGYRQMSATKYPR